MSTSASPPEAEGTLTPPAETAAWLVSELAQAVGPLASSSRLALAVQSPAGLRWLAASEHCPCSQGRNGVPCWTAPPPEGPRPSVIDLPPETGSCVVLCGGDSTSLLESAFRRVIEHILRHMELENDKELLQQELSISWECLEAVYDITANLRSLLNTEQLLARIIGKAAAIQEGLRIVLWLVDEDQLVAAAAQNVEAPTPRPLAPGLLGKTLATRQSIVINERSRLVAVEDLEVELRSADSLALVPIATREALLGVLEVWKEGNPHPFDFRLMHLLDTLAILAATVIENERLHRASLESDRLRREIEIGSRIQQTLLVGRPPLDLPAIHAAAITIPSQRIDGDFYDFFEHDKYLDIIVGDVMGKGIPAALLGAATKNHFLRAMNRLLAAGTSQLPQPKEIITILNPELVKELVDFGSFVTLIYARFDLRRRTLEFIDCGHTRPIHYQHRTGTFRFLQGFNMPLGFSDMDVYEQVSVPFEAGDVFFFYSDGVTEARSEAGVQFGEQQLGKFVSEHADDAPRDLVERVRRQIISWSHADTFVDDLTCVAVKIQEVPLMDPVAHAELEVSSALADLPRIRTFVRQVCEKYLDTAALEDSLWQLELGLTEAASNVMRHAYKGRTDGFVRVSVDLSGTVIVVRLYHKGEVFVPATEEVPAIEEPREGQMGRYLMQVCLDEVKYLHDGQGHQYVQLTKDLKATSSGEA